MLRQLGPHEKTTRIINNYCGLTYFFLIKLTEIIKIQSSVKNIGKSKKKSLYNQPKPYLKFFFIVKSFLARFLQILHQHIRNCLYFDWVFTHYVVMSDF
jgi:hypothetical protein